MPLVKHPIKNEDKFTGAIIVVALIFVIVLFSILFISPLI